MKVRELLSGPEKWCKGMNACDQFGIVTAIGDPMAAAWCLWGAIYKCYPRPRPIGEVIRAELSSELVIWNDAQERTFEEVKALVNRLDI